MAFGVQDFQDFVRLLEQHPEWRGDLRRLVLTEELLGLPGIVRELAEAQQRMQGELTELRQIVGELAAAHQQLAAEVRELAEAQRRTEEGLRGLAAAHQQLGGEVRELVRSQQQMLIRQEDMSAQLGRLRGGELERGYREHAGAYFDDLVRRAAPLTSQQLTDLLDLPEGEGRLSRAERREVLYADLVIRGRRWTDGAEVYLVVELSVGIGPHDVERAARRADLLGRLRPALAVVAGERITPEAEALAEARGVRRVLDGRSLAPPEREG